MPKVTKNYVRLHGPTTEQLAAIELLVSGKRDRETAEAVGVARETVTSWRLYDARFQAELNKRRHDVFSSSADRLRALLPMALQVLKQELANAANPNQAKLALDLIKSIGIPSEFGLGPTDPDGVVEQAARDRSGSPMVKEWGAGPVGQQEVLRVWEEAIAEVERLHQK